MPIIMSVDTVRGRLHVVADGVVTYPEIVAHLMAERDESDLSLPELIDATLARIDITSAEVRSIVDILRGFERTAALGPTAVLVADDASYGMLRVLEMLIDEVCHIRPFRRLDEAERWLAESVESTE